MKHKYIRVKQKDFILFQEKYGHKRLDKWNRIDCPSKGKLISKIFGKIYEEEIFNGTQTNMQ